MGRVRHLLSVAAAIAVVAVGGCASKYERAKVINFETDYPGMVRSGEITHTDTLIKKGEPIQLFVYRPGGTYYKLDREYTPEIDEVLKRDLLPGECVLDYPELRMMLLRHMLGLPVREKR